MTVLKHTGMVLMVLLMVVVVLVFLAPRFGWRVDTVLSGSMEPALKPGGIAVTRPVSPRDVCVGDIITFRSPASATLISHRVVGLSEGAFPVFRTQGDANEEMDSWEVSPERLVGAVCFHVPYAGYVTRFVRTPLGLGLFLFLPGLVVICFQLVNIWRVMSELEMRKNG